MTSARISVPEGEPAKSGIHSPPRTSKLSGDHTKAKHDSQEAMLK